MIRLFLRENLDVDVPGGKINENITFLPYKEPSHAFSPYEYDCRARRSLAAVAELKISDINKAPVGTTLALLERSLKVMSAVQARIHAAMKTEFQLLAAIIMNLHLKTTNIPRNITILKV